MKYVWFFSLLFFTQLSWSADEDTHKIHDYVDIAAESACKEHENPDSCQSEYKKQLSRIIMHQIVRSLSGVRHNFSADSDSGGVATSSVMDYPPQTSSQFCETHHPEKIESCLSAFNSIENLLKEFFWPSIH